MNPNTPPPSTTATKMTATQSLRFFDQCRGVGDGSAGTPSSAATASLPAASCSVSSTFSSSATVELVMSDLPHYCFRWSSFVPRWNVELNPHGAGVVERRFPEVEPVPGVNLD